MNKYYAKATVVDGQNFASLAEANYYQILKLQKRLGEINFYLRQVPLRFAGGGKLIIDFVIFDKNPLPKFVDVKGFATAAFKIKKKIIEATYPFVVETISTREVRQLMRQYRMS